MKNYGTVYISESTGIITLTAICGDQLIGKQFDSVSQARNYCSKEDINATIITVH